MGVTAFDPDPEWWKVRSESFVRQRWRGERTCHHGPPDPSALDVIADAQAHWVTFTDNAQPHGLALYVLDLEDDDPIFGVIEWWGIDDVRRSLWRYATYRGWHPIDPDAELPGRSPRTRGGTPP